MERQNRTWLCSVVFLDIVGYTKRSVVKQIEVKQDLSGLISKAVAQVPEQDRILVDTGDGAAVCFLADPVEALFFALGLRETLLSGKHAVPDYQCRIGINLGPVKVINDVTGRKNTLGDGINIAQRVMDFAAPNQILVSRSFYEVVSCLSDEYSALFSYRGVRKDKHVKSYDIYEAGGKSAEPEPDDVPPAGAPRSSAQAPGIAPGAEGAARPESAPAAAGGAATGAAAGGEAGASEAETADAEAEAGPVVPCGDCGDSGDHDGVHWRPEVLDAIQRELAIHIGPLARILIRRAACKTRTVTELRRFLARSINDPQDRDRFLDHTQRMDRAFEGPVEEAGAPPPGGAEGGVPGATSPSGAALPEPLLSGAESARVEKVLAQSLGPVAKVLLRRTLKQAGDREALVRALEEHLKPDERQAFRDEAGLTGGR